MYVFIHSMYLKIESTYKFLNFSISISSYLIVVTMIIERESMMMIKLGNV